MIEGLDIALSNLAHRAGQRITVGRGEQEMDVVAYEDVGVDRNAVFGRCVAQQPVQVSAIDVVHENGTSVHATLGDAQRYSGQVHSRSARHAAMVGSPASVCCRDTLRDRVGGRCAVTSVNYLRPLF